MEITSLEAASPRLAPPYSPVSAPGAGSAQPLALGSLWRELVAGRSFVLEGYCTNTECCLLLRRNVCVALAERGSASSVDMLERALTGQSQKFIAIDAALAPSTVASKCSDCLLRMGVFRTISAVPTLVLLAAHAARGVRLAPARQMREPAAQNEWRISYPRPDSALGPELTLAERGVTRLLVEGHTHAQIAKIRAKSQRTIANQLAASFRKLGVSGRTALVSKLLADGALGPANGQIER